MIYKITNTITGDFYIGKTVRTLEQRWYHHCKTAEYGSNTYFHKAIRKYGVESFTIEFIAEGLDEEEKHWITELRPTYNLTAGGTGGDTSKSPAYQAYISTVNRQGSNNHMYGRKGKQSPLFGRKLSEEHKKKLRESNYKPVRVEGMCFPSIRSAGEHFNRSDRWVTLHCERILK